MKALLMGYYGAANLGDDMMLVCLHKWLLAQGINITVLTENPGRVESETGLPAALNVPLCFQWAWRNVWLRGRGPRLIALILRHDMVIGGGGDLIRDDGGWKRFLFSIEKLILATLLGKRICLLNVGIGRPRTHYSRRLLRWTLRRCDLIVVRDRRSWELCNELGAGSRTRYAPDIVSMLPALLPRSVGGPFPEPYAVVALRTSANQFGRFDLTDVRVSHLARALDSVGARHGIRIVFLPFQSSGSEDDNIIHRRISERMTAASRFEVREWTNDLADITEVLRRAVFVVAMRLHAAILAHALGRRCILMPYDEKVKEFGIQAGISTVMTQDMLDDPARIEDLLERALGSDLRAIGERPPHSWENISLRSGAGHETPREENEPAL